MRNLSHTLSDLMPLIVSDREFDRLENRPRLESLTHELSGSVHRLGTLKVLPSADPGIRYVSAQFGDDLEDANSQLKEGHRAEARTRLRNVTRYCISCHTMTEDRVSDYGLHLNPDLSHLDFLDKAEYYAATRQFADSIKNFEYALTDAKWAKAHAALWNEGIQKLLAVVVRVKNDPSLTLEMVSRFFDSKTYPEDLAPIARKWKLDIRAWRGQAHAGQAAFTVKTARKLLAEAQGRQPREGLILNLRASAILHTLLAQSPELGRNAEILLLSGEAAEALADVNYWTLPSDYFESCVRVAPGGPHAAECLKRFQESLRARYLGAGSEAPLPAFLEKRVSELQGLR